MIDYPLLKLKICQQTKYTHKQTIIIRTRSDDKKKQQQKYVNDCLELNRQQWSAHRLHRLV